MKISKMWLPGLLAAALFVSCKWVIGDGKYVESKLRGTWVSASNTGPYSGGLKFDYDSIIITGYAAEKNPKPPSAGDENQPFKGFARDVHIPCYTEDSKLVLKTVEGDEQSFSYTYDSKGPSLRIAFKGGEEGLRRPNVNEN